MRRAAGEYGGRPEHLSRCQMDPASPLNWGWKTRRETASWLLTMLSKALSPTITASSSCGSPAVNGG
jgi:hypothetical protein